MWVNCPDVSKALWPSFTRVVSPSSICLQLPCTGMLLLIYPSVHGKCKQIDDGDTTLKNEGHSAFETSGQFTHIRGRYPRRRPGFFSPPKPSHSFNIPISLNILKIKLPIFSHKKHSHIIQDLFKFRTYLLY